MADLTENGDDLPIRAQIKQTEAATPHTQQFTKNVQKSYGPVIVVVVLFS